MGRHKGFHLSNKQKKFLSKFWKGKRMGEENPSKRPEVRKKIKLSWIKRKKKGWLHPCKGIPRTLKVKQKISLKNRGENNGRGRGDNVSHKSIHAWIRRRKVTSSFCEFCKKNKKLELSNISQKYHRNINDFKWLCRSCHMKYDYKFNIRVNRTRKKNLLILK